MVVYYNENGERKCRPMTNEELQNHLLLQWHVPELPYRFFLTNEQYLAVYSQNPDLITSFINVNMQLVKADGGHYFYYTEISIEHEALINMYSAEFASLQEIIDLASPPEKSFWQKIVNIFKG